MKHNFLSTGAPQCGHLSTNCSKHMLAGIQPQWKTTKIEDNLNSRLPQWKTTPMEDDLNGKGKKTSMEEYLDGSRPELKPGL